MSGRRYRLSCALALTWILATVGALGLAGCQTQSQVAEQENALAAAGFQLQIANTAARLSSSLYAHLALRRLVADGWLNARCP